jgi:hypothetical protein
MKKTQSIFVHIPKTGGKSILTSVYEVGIHDGFGHAPIEFYRSMFTSKVFEKLFKFAFVRNPWDRVYSGYKFAIQGGFGFENDLILSKEIAGYSFESFVKNWLPKQNIDIDKFTIFKPQYKFVCDTQNRILLDRICYFEQIKQEYQYIEKRLGCPAKLPHLNRSYTTKTYLDAYDEEMKKIIEQIYCTDIEIFNYTFSGCGKTGTGSVG